MLTLYVRDEALTPADAKEETKQELQQMANELRTTVFATEPVTIRMLDKRGHEHARLNGVPNVTRTPNAPTAPSPSAASSSLVTGPLLLAEVPAGYVRMTAETGLDPNARDCATGSAAMAKATGATVLAAQVVTMPFGKVCRSDMRFPDSKLTTRNFQWRPRERVGVSVSCSPFEEGEPSGIACTRFWSR